MRIFPNGLKVIKGEVFIMKDRCKGCGFCITLCPMKVLEVSQEFNTRGYHFPVIVNPDDCINCGLCEIICPDFAILSVLKEEKQVIEV